MDTKIRRRVVALATALACLALMAAPASATSHSATVTGGTIVLTTTGSLSLTLPFTGTAGTGCGSTLVLDQDATAGTYEVTGYSSATRFSMGGIGFVAVVTRTASTPGTDSGANLYNATLALRIDIFLAANADPATDCATSSLRCKVSTTLQPYGVTPTWTASSTGSLNHSATNAVITHPCTSPWSSLNWAVVTGAALAFHLTS